MAKAQAFAHRLVEFADYERCAQFFMDRNIDFDRPNDMGWSILMSVCACARDDLVGLVVDRTLAIDCATSSNRTTVLHLTAMSKNTRVIEELIATPERKIKLQRIIDQANAHGDTALMMACVAKNVRAVQLLLEMGANMSAINANGLNALMCAARVGVDPRPNAPSIEEMMAQSAAIVEILLANGADVNVAERAGGNTALHLAVLSENAVAVKSLLTNACNLDITLRNEAGNTAMDLSKRISGVASAQMEDLLSEKWAQYEKEAAQMSAKMEQELMDLAVKEAQNTSDTAQSVEMKNGKKKNRKTRKKAKAVTNTQKDSSWKSVATQELDDRIVKSTDEVVAESSVMDRESAEAQTSLNSTASDQIDDCGFEDDDSPWQSVVPKKSRRKQLLSESAEASPKQESKNSKRKDFAHNAKAKKSQARPQSDTDSAQEASSRLLKAASPIPVTRKASWTSQRTSSPKKGAISVPQHTPIASNISYDMMNASFHRTFPVSVDLEINVEKFLIASSVSDRELEPNDSLSISQVEALQESHWQAYHYLNEKKIELTRVLEAQRVEAQFSLHQELMQFK